LTTACQIGAPAPTATPLPTYTPYPTYTPVPTVRPTLTPIPEPTLIAGVDSPVTVSWGDSEVDFVVTLVVHLPSFKFSNGNKVTPSPGNVLLLIGADAFSGGPSVQFWPSGNSSSSVHILTTTGQTYWWHQAAWPDEEVGSVAWFFDVPPGTVPEKIFFPGGVEVDLSTFPVLTDGDPSG